MKNITYTAYNVNNNYIVAVEKTKKRLIEAIKEFEKNNPKLINKNDKYRIEKYIYSA